MFNKLQKVLHAFGVESPLISYAEIKNGNINHTYRLDTEDGSAYIAQAVNTNVFHKPIEVMQNIDAVTQRIRERMPDSTALCFERAADGNNYLFDETGIFWRMFNYIESITYNTCSDLQVIRETGHAFGCFQTALNDFDASSLYFTIPDFHNTIARFDALRESVRKDPAHRVKEVEAELEAIFALEEEACTHERMYRAGELPLRVTHNDTKINNVLFDCDTHKAICIIDLDTVMPGLMAHDFGDAIRFAANYVEEDCPEADRAGINLDVFRAFTEGFLAEVRDSITPYEAETLALSALTMTAELAVRFLKDYIDGDIYFKVNYPGHNLVRTRCQLALAQDMHRRMNEMRAIVSECMTK